MKIYCHHGEIREALKVDKSGYRCYSPEDAEVSDVKKFRTIEAAAVFLIRNPDWGILVEAGRTFAEFDKPMVAYHSLGIDLK